MFFDAKKCKTIKQLKSQKKKKIATSKVIFFNLTIDLLSLGIYAPRPQTLTYRPKFCGEFESELRSGFRARNGELKGSGVSGIKAIKPRNVWSGASGAGNPNMKLVLV